jgi:hypothetical protein
MIKKTIIVSTLTVLLTLSIYAFFAHNETDIAFIPQNPGGDGTISLPKASGSIGYLISKGAGFFLKSHSDMLLFLNLIEISEISGLDFVELQKALNSAIDNIEKASETYHQLKSLAAVTPYNQEVIDKLIVFDYDGFEREKGLNAVIFGKVKKILSIGDVREAYNLFYKDLEYLFERIKSLKSTVDSERIPKISELWRINQKYSELQLFGQYLSEVFYALR